MITYIYFINFKFIIYNYKKNVSRTEAVALGY